MNKWWKGLLFLQGIIIIILLLFIISHTADIWPKKQAFELISPRISSGLLQPQSYLILNYAPLREDLEAYIDATNGKISIYIVNLRDGASLSIGANEHFVPASMGKVPIAILILKKVEEGKLSLETIVEIKDSDQVKYSSRLFDNPEKNLPIRILVEKMLQDSDNTAYRALVRFLEWEDTNILSGYWDFLSNDRIVVENNEQINYITPRAVYNIFGSSRNVLKD